MALLEESGGHNGTDQAGGDRVNLALAVAPTMSPTLLVRKPLPVPTRAVHACDWCGREVPDEVYPGAHARNCPHENAGPYFAC